MEMYLRTLAELLKGTSAPAIRLRAARAVLELAKKVGELADLELRLAVLEERLKDQEGQSAH